MQNLNNHGAGENVTFTYPTATPAIVALQASYVNIIRDVNPLFLKWGLKECSDETRAFCEKNAYRKN